MKKVVIAVVVILLLVGYASYYSVHGRCASCEEYERIDNSCPYCFASICDSCLDDVKSEIEQAEETHYESGHSDGYDFGYELGYELGYDDGYNDGYGENEDELYFWREFAVIVTSTGKKYHTYDCYHIEDRPFQIFNIATAKARGYTACLDCIE